MIAVIVAREPKRAPESRASGKPRTMRHEPAGLGSARGRVTPTPARGTPASP